MKFQRNQENINIDNDIQSNLRYIHWPSFADEKEESVVVGGVNVPKSRVALKHWPLKGMWNKVMSILHIMYDI